MSLNYVHKLIVLLVVFVLIKDISSWRRRRRRPPPCPIYNCEVGYWSSWSSCSHPCGYSGEQSRSRQKTWTEQCGGSCPYTLSETRSCNRDACQHGGTPGYGYCRCRAGFDGTCCQYDENECITQQPCQHMCTNTHGSYTCQCNPCYTKVGTRCDLRQCAISGNCYKYSNVNPSNQCQDCNAGNKYEWTNNNALQCSDGQACTRADHCSNGRCVGTPFTCLSCEICHSDTCKVKPGYCTIVHQGKKTCFNNKVLRPGYPCQQCDSNNPHKWTSNNNLPCSDNNVKTKDDRCVSGSCRGTPYTCLPCERHDGTGCPIKSGHCIIQHNSQRTCFANQHLKPGNPCQWCNVSSSASTWTNRNNVSCNDRNQCTRSDKCSNGQCVGTSFKCNSHCQTCNGQDCSQKPGFGFVQGKCTCKISGKDFNHQQLNPANQCQWCNLYDVVSKLSGAWTNRPSIPCNDNNACTHKDMCSNGSCTGQRYSCQSSYPSSSCVKTSVCLGDGRCKDIMRPSRTICRPAKDACDQPERCNGQLSTCPADSADLITIKTGSVKFKNPSFSTNTTYQHITNALYISLTGFSISCGAMKYKWFLLDSSSQCKTTAQISKGDLPNANSKQTISGLTLLDGKRYKIAIQSLDMRGAVRPLVCSSPVTIDNTRPTKGWVYDGTSADIDFQATKTIRVNWGGFSTRNGIAKYEWKATLTTFGSNASSDLIPFTGNGVNTRVSKTFNNILDGSKVKVTVRAYTKAGLYTDSTSDGVIIDLSKPAPATIYDGPKTGINMKYAKWTSTFLANWDAFTDPHSGMSHYEWAVKRLTGLITAFTPTGLTRSTSASGLNLVSGEKYCAVVKGYNKAGLSNQASSDCVLIDRDRPMAGIVNDGLSHDLDHQSNGSAISANWNGFNDGAKGSGIVGYQYKIHSTIAVIGWTSIGLKKFITHSGLSLQNGVKYFVTVRAVDAVGLSSDVQSNGVIVDTTSPVFNGRIKVKGIKDVFKGKPCVYTTSNTTLDVSWVGFTDGHSGVARYEWAVMPSLQTVKPSDFKQVSGSPLTTSASFSSLGLLDGKEYKVIIRAYNRVFLHTDAVSDIIIPDPSRPQPGKVSDGSGNDINFQASLDHVKATWTVFIDPDTAIRQYYYAVGSCTQGNYHVTNNRFIPVNPALSTSMSLGKLNLVNGQRYCTKVKAQNMAGIYSVEVTSDGFIADATPPETKEGRVIDGPSRNDIDYQSNLTEMSGSWDGFKDPQSDIQSYEFGISRNKAGTPDILPLTNVGLKTSARATHLSLSEDVYYYIVCAKNKAGLKSCKSSDGVVIDKTQPSKGIVNDGILEPDLKYQTSLTNMAANWEGIWDLESRIERFEWAVKDSNVSANVVQDFTDVGTTTHVKNDRPLSLLNGKTYKVHLKVYNYVGFVREITSDGVTVDSTPPHPSTVYPGDDGTKGWIYNSKEKMFYSSMYSHLYAHWIDFREEESELWYYKWAIGTSRCGTQIQPFTNIGRSTYANSTMSDFQPVHGIKYYVTVTAKNKADLISRSCSDAFVIDKTPPRLGVLNAGDPSQHQKYIGSNIVQLYWKEVVDRESGIMYCDFYISNSTDQVFITQVSERGDGNVSIRRETFQYGQEYKALVKCTNKANLTTIQTSDPFIIDATPPVHQNDVTVGVSRDNSMQYQSDNTSITATWTSFVDMESPMKEYRFAVGTSALDDDIVALTTVGMATTVSFSELSLSFRERYYVTILGVNAAGLNTSAQALPLIIDDSVPEVPDGAVMDGRGDVDWDFLNPKDQVQGHWVKATDPESGILKSKYCLGTRPRGCQVMRVTETNATSFVCTSCKIKDGEMVYVTVKITNGAGLSVIRSSNGMLMDASLPIIGQVLDGNDESGKDMDTILLNWNMTVNWHGAEDMQSGVEKCQWKIVNGFDQEFFTRDISQPFELGSRNILQSNQSYDTIPFNSSEIYYNVIECRNGARLSNKVKSNGFRAVVQWPLPGNVLDGLVPGKDLGFLTSTKEAGAQWDSFKADSRDPVMTYSWSIGTKPGNQKIMKFKDAKLKLKDEVILAPEEVDLDVLEPGQTYFITVQGTSVSGLSSYQSSNGFQIDTTPPTKTDVKVSFVVVDESSPASVDLRIDWSEVKDDESGIMESEFCVGTTPGACLTKMISAGNSTNQVLASFKPVTLEGYYAIVVVTNTAGLKTTMTSQELIIDTSPPTRGQVIDGIEMDVDFMNATNRMSVKWAGFLDRQSSVRNCTWSLVEQSSSSDGSYYGNDTIIFEQEVPSRGKLSRDGLALKPGSRYVNVITCSNRDGFKISSRSDGVVVDLTPPLSSNVFDGAFLKRDINFTCDTSEVSASWDQFSDVESGISEYRWALGTSPGKDDIVGFIDVGTRRHGKAKNLTLAPGGPYYVTVEATNKAGLSSQGWSDGFIVDESPPELKLSPISRLWISQSEHITASWQSNDPQSGIKSTEYCIGTSITSCQIKPITLLPSSDSKLSCTDCTLRHNTKYFTTIRVWNTVGLYTIKSTESIQTDFTPPTTGKIVPWSRYTSCTASCELKFNLTDFQDPESGVSNCAVGVRNSSGFISDLLSSKSSDVVSFKNLSLYHGQRYSVAVGCMNGAGLETNVVSEYDVLVDVTPPTKGIVIVSPDRTHDVYGIHSPCHLYNTTLRIHWAGFQDPETGITGFSISLTKQNYSSNVVVQPKDVGLTTSTTMDINVDQGVFANEIIYFVIEARNAAGLVTRVQSPATRLVSAEAKGFLDEGDFFCLNV